MKYGKLGSVDNKGNLEAPMVTACVKELGRTGGALLVTFIMRL